jgi:ATP-dependent RNA helicase HelY
VVDLPGGKRRGRHVVIDISEGQDRGPRLQVMSEERTVTWLQPFNLSAAPRVAGRLRLPPAFQPKDARSRRLLARRLSRLNVERAPQASEEEDASDDLQRALEEHPSRGCTELNRHLHFWRRAVKLEREVAGIERRVSRRSQTLSRRFERVLEVLQRLGCVTGWALTSKGETLARIYNESDLLVVEALEEGIFEGLDSAELAGLLSSLVYETRGPELDVVVLQPTRAGGRAWERLVRLWGEISSEEQLRGLELTREPDPGFSQQAYRWASGAGLEDVLGPDDAPGDFVRSTKQLIDLVRQLIDAVPEGELLESLRTCADALHRGVVAYSSLEL